MGRVLAEKAGHGQVRAPLAPQASPGLFPSGILVMCGALGPLKIGDKKRYLINLRRTFRASFSAKLFVIFLESGASLLLLLPTPSPLQPLLSRRFPPPLRLPEPHRSLPPPPLSDPHGSVPQPHLHSLQELR